MTSRSSIPLREYTYLLYEIFIGIEAEASVLGIPQIFRNMLKISKLKNFRIFF